MTQILNEEQTKAAQEKLEQQLNEAVVALKDTKSMLVAGLLAKKVSELAVKGISQGTKAKQIVSFFTSTMISSYKEAMEQKKAKDKALEEAIRLVNLK